MKQADSSSTTHVPRIFVICDQADTAPIWGFILRKDGVVVHLEKDVEKALDHWSMEIPDLTVVDVDAEHHDLVEFCKTIRDVSVTPILLLLPSYNEKQILKAYEAGVDDVIIKPISPKVFQAKILAWVRRSWSVPVGGLDLVQAGRHELDPMKRCLINFEGREIKLTNLEFNLLHLLMSRPGQVITSEELIQSIWGVYGSGDQILLKNIVYRLRRKIEADPRNPALLLTWPKGYSFQG